MVYLFLELSPVLPGRMGAFWGALPFPYAVRCIALATRSFSFRLGIHSCASPFTKRSRIQQGIFFPRAPASSSTSSSSFRFVARAAQQGRSDRRPLAALTLLPLLISWLRAGSLTDRQSTSASPRSNYIRLARRAADENKKECYILLHVEAATENGACCGASDKRHGAF